ncbi:MAG: hypothetical protein EOO42_00845 [Flavobacteriales bacterium]|nr:MAG: hypothetical protein EOO42_00845 [Flavobacteriales bacterium]
MISIFKNFYNKPSVLDSAEVKSAIVSMSKNHNDGRKDVSDYLPSNVAKIYGNKEVLETLNVYYHNKCAYCEQKQKVYVAHYRPKSKYPWLSLEWSNLLPICKDCNSSLSNKFDIGGRAIRLTSSLFNDDILLANSEILLQEEPLLLHPEVDSPENHIYFDNNGFAVGRTSRGRYTIEVLRLNRIELKAKRLEVIDSLYKELLGVFDSVFNGFLKVRGQLIQQNLPEPFQQFFRHLYELREANNEFSRVYQSIWENLDNLDQSIFKKEEDNSRFRKQILIFQKLFISGVEAKTKSDHNAVLSFKIQNIEGIRNVELINLSPKAKWIFLTGENGYGKSTLLKAIAAGLAGNYIGNENFRSIIRLQCHKEDHFDSLKADKRTFETREFVWQTDQFLAFNRIAAYGANRTRMSKDYSSIDNPLDHIMGKRTELLNIERYLTDTYGRRPDEVSSDVVVSTLKQIIPQLAEIKIDNSNDLLEVKYYEYSDDQIHSFKEVSFDQLATGIRSVIALVGDILCRFLINRNVTGPAEIEGIVVIDEIDIHLHPKWQKKLPELLSKAFPKVQFIASTHSPIPLLGAPINSVFLTVGRSFDKGIEIERLIHLENDIDRLTPNLLLNSEIFGFTEVISSNVKSGKFIYTEDTTEELKFNKQLEDSIKNDLSEDKKQSLRKLLNKNSDK